MSIRDDREARSPALPATSPRGAAARRSTLREHNLALVLQRIIAAHAGNQLLSRAAIAGEVGLARASVSDLVDQLIAARLVAELDPMSTPGAGRPAVPLAPAPRSVVALGLSIGTDHLAAAAVDLTGARIAERFVDCGPHTDPFETFAQLGVIAAETCSSLDTDKVQLAGACVALPGVVSRESARLRVAPNLGWRDIAVDASLLRQPSLAGLRVSAGNDADLAARTEVEERLRRGIALADQSYLFVLGDVGIGSAVVIGGDVFGGTHGWSGEIGHVMVRPDGAPCHCGSVGCLEPYAGRHALARAAGLPETASVADVRRSAGADPHSAAAIAAAAIPLGQATATVVNVVDVDELVLGGTYAALFDHLATGVRTELERRALIAHWASVRLSPAIGGPMAAAHGAALTVLDGVLADPAAWIDATSV